MFSILKLCNISQIMFEYLYQYKVFMCVLDIEII